MRELSSQRIEFSIGQMLLFVDQSHCIRSPADLSFKQPVETLVLQSTGCSSVLLHQQELLLLNLRWYRHIYLESLPHRCKGIISRIIVSAVCNFTPIAVNTQGRQLLCST